MRKTQFLLASGLTLLSADVFTNCSGYSGPGDGVYTLPGSHIHSNASGDCKVPVVGLSATSASHAA